MSSLDDWQPIDKLSKLENVTSFFHERSRMSCELLHNFLREIPPEVRVTNSWTKTLYQGYSHRIANFWTTLLNIFSKEIIFNNTKCRKQSLKFRKPIESNGEIKLRMQFCLYSHISLNLFQIYFSFIWKLFFVLLQATIHTFSEKNCNILKIILVHVFCPLETGIAGFAGFAIGFQLSEYFIPVSRDVYVHFTAPRGSVPSIWCSLLFSRFTSELKLLITQSVLH